MVSIWWNNISKISNVPMKSKVVVTKLAQGKQNVTHLTLLLACILNHNKKWNNLDKCTSTHVSTKKIRSKPNLPFRDFSRWPPFDISNSFITFSLLLYLSSFMSIVYLLQLLWLFEIFYRNATSAIFKMAAVPANFNFQISCFYHILNYCA